MAREVTLVDAGLGSVASVERALIQVGGAVRVTRDPDQVARSRMVVFSGQSAFGAASKAIVDGAMGAALKMVVERGDPFLGICMGMQLLFDGSDENGGQEGLRVLPGRCRRFPDGMSTEAEPGAEPGDPAPAAAPAPERPPEPKPVVSDAPAQMSLGGFGSEPSANSPNPLREGVETTPSASEASEPQAEASEASPILPVETIVSVPSAASALPNPAPSAAPVTASQPEPETQPEGTVELIRRVKVPHMGWNEVEPTGDHYYFVHSYYVEAGRAEDIMWISTYGGVRFPAAVRRENVLGCQFHPEKSQRAGLKFLRAFILGGWG